MLTTEVPTRRFAPDKPEQRELSILQLIHSGSGYSRLDLARKTGLSPSSITAIVRKMMGTGLITESTAGSSVLGRKPVPLEIRGDCGYLVGIDMGSFYTRTVVTDINGRIAYKHQIETGLADGRVRVLKRAFRCVDQAIKAVGVPRRFYFGHRRWPFRSDRHGERACHLVPAPRADGGMEKRAAAGPFSGGVQGALSAGRQCPHHGHRGTMLWPGQECGRLPLYRSWDRHWSSLFLWRKTISWLRRKRRRVRTHHRRRKWTDMLLWEHRMPRKRGFLCRNHTGSTEGSRTRCRLEDPGTVWRPPRTDQH